MTGCSGCRGWNPAGSRDRQPADFIIALAGNANVGKSATFNQLTGVDQIIGNWPGKTVERAEGVLQYKGHRIRVIDLPGIYSLSTYSMEELVSREFIAREHPDAVVNVIDASALERNLFFTIQLMELGTPLVVAVNQMDLAEKKGIRVDTWKLAKILGVPVVPTVAIQGKGISPLTDAILDVVKKRAKTKPPEYGKEVEEQIAQLLPGLQETETGYPARWAAIKLLERDPEMRRIVDGKNPEISALADRLAGKLETIHGEASSIVMSSERYLIADRIASEVMVIQEPSEGRERASLTERIDRIALHPAFGYFLVTAVIGGLLAWTFLIGAQISLYLTSLFSMISPQEPVLTGPLWGILWNGAFTGFVAGVTLIIPYILPFYLILAAIEDSGYLTRISMMLDRGMHRLGLHGKAIIPLILGYGCNVPALYSCRIMESPKQKLLGAFLVTLVPCTARTVVILGLVAAFVSPWWALGLYAFDVLLIIALGRIAFRAVPGESVGLIMEMPEYHVPSLSVILKQTWSRTKSLFFIVFPAYIIGSAVLQALYAAGFLTPVNTLLEPITTIWLGLPEVVGIILIFGIIRKELTILTLAILFHTTNFATVLTPVQLIVLTLVTMIYIPCIATILALAQEFGWKKSLGITVIEVLVAIVIGGIAFRLLGLFM
jgi:ferrous iron transport protein B